MHCTTAIPAGQKGAVKKQPDKKRRISEMGSSVHLCAVLGLWITFRQKMCTTITTPRNFAFPGDYLLIKLRRFLHCHLFQVVLIEVKTAGY